MSMSNAQENASLLLLYNATTWANVAINATSSPITDISVAMHTADPGEGGTQTTSEVTYTGYARVDVVRTSGGWTVTGNSVSPAANIVFPTCTAAAGAVITHFSTGVPGGGATAIFDIGTVAQSITVTVSGAPTLTTASTITRD